MRLIVYDDRPSHARAARGRDAEPKTTATTTTTTNNNNAIYSHETVIDPKYRAKNRRIMKTKQ